MREILFRGKKRLCGTWKYGCGVFRIKTDKIYELIEEVRYKHDNGSPSYSGWIIDIKTLGQYTGKNDKYSTKIFDGDIVTDDDYIGVVKWDDEEAMFTIIYDNICTHFGNEHSTSWEVVGNIHDNPELIEKEKI